MNHYKALLISLCIIFLSGLFSPPIADLIQSFPQTQSFAPIFAISLCLPFWYAISKKANKNILIWLRFTSRLWFTYLGAWRVCSGAPRVSLRPQGERVYRRVGESVRFECIADGDPLPNIELRHEPRDLAAPRRDVLTVSTPTGVHRKTCKQTGINVF